MSTLHTRLSLALVLIIATLGAAFYGLVRWSTQEYYAELTQRLNSSIAMYVTGQTRLISGGQVDRAALATLAERAMVINPSVEVYLLDAGGRIIAHGLEPAAVRLERVDLDPVRALIDGKPRLPLRGSDPRNPDRARIFSAAEVRDASGMQGYLYVVLGGEHHDALARSIRASYILTVASGAVAVLVVAGTLIGVLAFSLLTRRLRRLHDSVHGFAESGFDPANTPALLRDPHGLEAGTDEIARLGSAFVAMARKIAEQFEQVQANDRLRRELISNVSHDLRTPLAAMHGYLDTLLLKNEELDPGERERYLRIAYRHTERLRALIGDLFELSKLDAGDMNLTLEAFSVAELLHDVVQGFQLEAERRGVAIVLPGEPHAAIVRADIALMQRVLENLIRNALENTPRGGRITISIDPRPDRVMVSVSDTGCGIPDHALESIFERLVSGTNPAAGSASSGLGLAIVKRILDLHGSRISVESRVNEGTRFAFGLATERAA